MVRRKLQIEFLKAQKALRKASELSRMTVDLPVPNTDNHFPILA